MGGGQGDVRGSRLEQCVGGTVGGDGQRGMDGKQETYEERQIKGVQEKQGGGRNRNKIGETDRRRQGRVEVRQGQGILSPGPWNA